MLNAAEPQGGVVMKLALADQASGTMPVDQSFQVLCESWLINQLPCGASVLGVPRRAPRRRRPLPSPARPPKAPPSRRRGPPGKRAPRPSQMPAFVCKSRKMISVEAVAGRGTRPPLLAGLRWRLRGCKAPFVAVMRGSGVALLPRVLDSALQALPY